MHAKFFTVEAIKEFNPTKAFETWEEHAGPLMLQDMVVLGQNKIYRIVRRAHQRSHVYYFVEPVPQEAL